MDFLTCDHMFVFMMRALSISTCWVLLLWPDGDDNDGGGVFDWK